MDTRQNRDSTSAVMHQGAEPTHSDDPAEIREQIEQTREEVALTAAALADKTDVKGRAKRRIGEVRDQVENVGDELKDQVERNTPDSAGEAMNMAKARARQYPLPVAAGVAIAMAITGFVIGRLSTS